MKKIKVAFFAIATLTLLATSTACSSRKVASAKASEAPSAKPEEESSANAAESVAEEKEAEKSTASNGGVIVPGATVKGAIEGSKVFIAGRTVTIPSLWVCDHEVTQEEYRAVEGTSPEERDRYFPEYVIWYDTLVYCNKRSIAEGLTPCYKIRGKTNPSEWGEMPISFCDVGAYGESKNGENFPIWDAVTCDFSADGYRLPTEAEWEYLARGGNISNSGQTEYSGSNDIEAVAWYGKNSGYDTHEVKTKAPNALGLYDMSGNVAEWCWDRWTDTITAGTPSAGVSSGDLRVLRGGSWRNSASTCTVSDCHYGEPDFRPETPYQGFRVVRTVSNNDVASASAKNESDKKTASNGGANKPLTVTGQIADSQVFIKGRTVEIWAKWCCDHEVTQSEYNSVMGSNPSYFSSNPASGETQANRPVETVSWYDALVYCNKKSAQAGRTPCYKVNGNADTSQWGYTPNSGSSISGTITCDFTADGYRLPTEAEWE
ncbi:MAG: SUMF1/EgtB/PvdO family nonheme iron enzyme, partial [Treponema sp.]|nr:SUMF1/EgtB/PvdO family nonheme iron enzyme [Treponema sp.]